MGVKETEKKLLALDEEEQDDLEISGFTEKKMIEMLREREEKVREEYTNMIELFWIFLRGMETKINIKEDVLDKINVVDGYKIWNKLHNSTLKPYWETTSLLEKSQSDLYRVIIASLGEEEV